MEDLIKALQIFLKYNNKNYPTHCEHEILMVLGITEDEVSEEDKIELDKLGFEWNEKYEEWTSFRYGSA